MTRMRFARCAVAIISNFLVTYRWPRPGRLLVWIYRGRRLMSMYRLIMWNNRPCLYRTLRVSSLLLVVVSASLNSSVVDLGSNSFDLVGKLCGLTSTVHYILMSFIEAVIECGHIDGGIVRQS